jgi:hypothetical protein
MFQLLYKYLVLYRNVNIPGVGRLTIEPVAASVDLSRKTIHPPLAQINFSTKTTLADRKFYHFICREMSINEVDAVKQFQTFTETIKSNLKAQQAVLLPGIGSLSASENGDILFEREDVVHSFFPDASTSALPQVNQKSEESTTVHHSSTTQPFFTEPTMQDVDMEMGETQRDYWWVWALLLAGIGIAAIYYYYNFMA